MLHFKGSGIINFIQAKNKYWWVLLLWLFLFAFKLLTRSLTKVSDFLLWNIYQKMFIF